LKKLRRDTKKGKEKIMAEIIGVRFKPVGKTYYFDPQDFEINKGDNVIVETSRGIEYGTVVVGRKEINDDELLKPIKPIMRPAQQEDHERYRENKKKEKEAFDICAEKIKRHGLEMKLIEVEYTFDGSKILFYFTADGRVDFRELVKDLAMVFRTRIELRQIGVRDESKTIGSIGVCGRSLCCSKFLGEFAPVSIKMAKEQGLSLNPSKISGACGRLMCCLKYEQDTYEELLKKLPRHGALVKTPDGNGIVESVSVLKEKVKVSVGEEKERTIKEYSASEIKVLKNTKRREDEDTVENISHEDY
jgi:cell fate regulator YaaT (PSP1 superfamily)